MLETLTSNCLWWVIPAILLYSWIINRPGDSKFKKGGPKEKAPPEQSQTPESDSNPGE